MSGRTRPRCGQTRRILGLVGELRRHHLMAEHGSVHPPGLAAAVAVSVRSCSL